MARSAALTHSSTLRTPEEASLHTITSAQHQPTTQDTVPHPGAYIASVTPAEPSVYIQVGDRLIDYYKPGILHVTRDEFERVIALAMADARSAR